MSTASKYDRIVVQQLDPDSPAAGGVDSCLRDLLAGAPSDLRILLLGVSLTAPLHTIQQRRFGDREIDFMPVARLHPLAERRLVPHSIRVVLGALLPLIRHASRDTAIETHRFEAGFVATFVRRSKLVMYAHTDPTAVVGSDSDSFWRRMPRLYAAIEARVLRKAARTIVFSSAGAEHYRQKHTNVIRASTWYNDELFTLDEALRPPRTLIWVGRFEAPKDPLLAIEVLDSLKRRSEPDWKLLMIGDGSLRERVEQEISTRSLHDSVVLLGPRSRAEVAAELGRASALLMSSNFEGSPVVLYESMAVGTPVIAPTAADPDRVIIDGRNGYRTARDAESLAEVAMRATPVVAADVASTVAPRAMTRAVQEIWALAG